MRRCFAFVLLACICNVTVTLQAQINVPTRKPYSNHIGNQINAETIRHSQKDHTFVNDYIFQIKKQIEQMLSEPSDKPDLDKATAIIEKLKQDANKILYQYFPKVNTWTLKLNQILITHTYTKTRSKRNDSMTRQHATI